MKRFLHLAALLVLITFAAAVLLGCGKESDPGSLIFKKTPGDADGDITLSTADGRASATFAENLFRDGAKLGLSNIISSQSAHEGLPAGRVPISAVELRLIKPAPDDKPPPGGGDGGEGEGGDETGDGGEEGGDGDGADETGGEEPLPDAIGGTVTLSMKLTAEHGWPGGAALALYKFSESLKEWRDTGATAAVSEDSRVAEAAIDRFGKYAVMSPLPAEIPPPAPGAPDVEIATKTVIRLKWDAPAYGLLAGYNVYRSQSADGEYAKANAEELKSPEFSEKPAGEGEYFYRVSVVSTSGLESEPGAYVRAEVRGTDFYGVLGGQSGTAGSLSSPWGVAVLPNTGEILASDAGAHRLVLYTPAGKYRRAIGSPGFGTLKFSSPKGIAVSPGGGRIYVADSGNNSVVVLGADLAQVTRFGNFGFTPGNMTAPEAVAVRADGVVFVSDTGNGRIQYFTPSGTYMGHFSETGDTFLDSPSCLAFAADGALFVSDKGASRVVKFTQDLEFDSEYKFEGIKNVPPLGAPAGLAFSLNGTVFVADYGAARIIAADLAGEFQYQFGSRGVGNGEFGPASPRGIAFDASTGLLYVCDAANSRVQIFEP